MAGSAWPILTRKRPFAVGRLFSRRFGAQRRNCVRAGADRRYRNAVEATLAAQFGAPLPPTLDWLVAAAWRRSITVDELVDFLGAVFDLEPLAGR